MPDSIDQYMRLFKGHLKMDQDTLANLFVSQLSNIYCSKSHLLKVLPELADKASFAELKSLIMEAVDSIKIQILRMDVIYKKLNETYNEEKCVGIGSIILEAYMASHLTNISVPMIDMSILTHLRVIESIEITGFDILADIAASLQNHDVLALLDQNLRSSVNTKRMYELISKEYIS